MDKYDQIETADEKGYALFRRVSDGKTARVPVRWFKKDGGTGWYREAGPRRFGFRCWIGNKLKRRNV